MRRLFIFSLAWFCFITLGISAQSDPKAGAKKILTLRAAAEKAKTLLSNTSDTNQSETKKLSDLLSDEMLKRVESFKSSKGGEEPGRKWLEAWRLQELEKSVNETIEWAKEQSPLPINRTEVLKRAAKNWSKEASQEVNEYAKKTLNMVYSKARELASTEQLKKLRENMAYPSSEELNNRVTMLFEKTAKGIQPLSSDKFADLDNWLKGMVVNTGPVFDEVTKKVSEMSADFRRELAKQYKAQFEIIRNEVQGNKYAPALKARSELYVSSLDKLKQGIKENLTSKPPIYGTFKAIEKLAERAAAHWEAKRLENFLKTAKVWMPNEKELEKDIRSNLTKHLLTKDSLNLLTEKYFKQASSLVSKQYGGDKLSNYFDEEFSKAGDLARTLTNQFQESLKQKVNAVRKRIADEQFSKKFSFLQDDNFPEEPIIRWYHERGKSTVSSFQDLADSLSIDENGRSQIFEETRRMAVQKMNQLIQPALKSMRVQVQLIKELEKQNIDQLKIDVSERIPVDQILRKWEADWQNTWNKKQEQAVPKWRSKFNLVGEELNKVVRQLYEGMEYAMEKRPSSIDAPSEELGGDADSSTSDAVPTQNEQPEPQKKEEKPEQTAKGGTENKTEGITEELKTYIGLADGVFAFSDLPNGRCRMLFGAPSGAGGFILEFDPQNVQGAAKLISEGLKRPLGIVLEKNSEKENSGFFNLLGSSDGDSEIKMLFKVSTPAVRHQMSILVRQQVEKAIDEWAKKSGRKAPDLIWQDDVEL